MEKIIVIGCPGAGKTTLSIKLSKILDLPLLHLDKIYHISNTEQIEREKFDEILSKELSKERWIIDGNYNRTLPVRFEACDTVIFLDLSTASCLFGAFKRLIRYHGKTRPDMGGTFKDKFDPEFYRLICKFKKTGRERILSLIEEHKDKKIIILHTRKEVDKFVQSFEKANKI